jgi:hypothetical protein
VLSIVIPQHTEIPVVPVNMGFDGSVKSRQRSRDPKRRDERIFQYYAYGFDLSDRIWVCFYNDSRCDTLHSFSYVSFA